MAKLKFDVTNRFSGAVQFTAEIECDKDAAYSLKVGLAVRWAIKSGAYLSRAYLSRAYLSGADLSGADLSRADLSRADLSGADLSRADLSRAYLSGADLSGAYLSGADLSRAYLSRAYLSGADLSRAKYIANELVTPLMMLLDQPGKIRAYKLVNERGTGPHYHGIEYAIGKTIEVAGDTDPKRDCSYGINVASLDWCLKAWEEGFRILVVEFEAKDIACIPLGSDGKFRLHRCTVIEEKQLDYVALGLVKKPEPVAA